MSKKLLLLIPALLVLPLLALACSDDDGGTGNGDPAARGAVEQTISGAIAAYGRQDLATFLNYWTDDGLQSEFGATRQEITAAGREFFGGPALSLGNFVKTDVKGDKATSDFELVFGISKSPQRFELVQQNGAWKIDATQDLKASIPSGTTAVDVDLDEFSFKVDTAKLAGGNFAFRMDNVGEQEHELVLLKVPASFGLQQLLQAVDQDVPEGVEPVGFGGPVQPGDDSTLVFTQRLSAGKYMMVCFLPDENDPSTPHILKGMGVEFNVTG